MEDHIIRWFDHHLKGVDNGVEREPKVRYYVMGAVGESGAPGNEWRTATDWPLSAKNVAYYLQADRTLSTVPSKSDDATVTYQSDPKSPAPIPGLAFPGAKDAREYESHADVRTFTTDVLTEPVEWTGKVKAELYVSSDAKDCDFIVRVSDVYPDGRSILIVDYVRRARYREGFEQEVLMESGKVHKVAFDVGWLSQIFNKGHRIRVTVASTGAPFIEPNPQTGEALTVDFPDKTFTATNAIHVNRHNASRILAPVREK
jgi:putative CocE/NonD family hydrolase